ncbi:UNVERIFIED_CONTAM: DNA-directed RNA polymerase subunit H [Euhalothece sp. KZN 001]|jgi:DNA-directed RNA polymerase subunit H
MADVTQHRLVPDHEVIDEDEVSTILARYGIEASDLPKIRRRDPALPEDAAEGDVIRITRDSRTTERAVSYRLVIE